MLEKEWQNPHLIAVRGIILNSEGKILLTKRPEADFEGGKWCIPGGKLEIDEEIIAGGVREVLEEVGELIDLTYHKTIRNSEGWLTHYLFGRLNKLPTNLQESEVDEVGFFDDKEIDGLDMAFDHRDVAHGFFASFTT